MLLCRACRPTCLPLVLQAWKAARLAGVGGAARNTLRPASMWYHTADPPMSTCQSVKAPAGPARGQRNTGWRAGEQGTAKPEATPPTHPAPPLRPD
jgi:hypothetical protein